MLDLKGKGALVTGAGTRVGAAIAQALGAEGMRVAVHYHHSRAGAEHTCAAIERAGGRAEALAADLHDRAAARALVGEALAYLGGLDVLVCNAANYERVAFADIDDAAWDRALGLNLTAGFVLAHAASRALGEREGSIIFVTCTSTRAPYRDYLPYVVSKGATRQLMRGLALELAPAVRVNAVAPGTVAPPPDMPADRVADIAANLPLGRVGDPHDVAQGVLHLVRARSITGQELVVDGGSLLVAG